MSIYLGVRCPVCSKKFTSSDDVVVCPVCGAPHHRECYAQQNACAFESEHLSGKVWRATPEPSPQEEAPQTAVACPRCHSMNPKESKICQVCGMILPGEGGGWPKTGYGAGSGPAGQPGGGYGPQSQQKKEAPPGTEGFGWGFPGMENMMDPATMIYGGLSPDEEIEGEVVRDMALYIGENSAYYLGRFKAISQAGRTLTVNFSAFFFNFFYYFYRKMYLPGCILLAVFLAALVPDLMYSVEMFPQAAAQLGLSEYFQQLGFDLSREVNLAAAQHYARLSRLTHLLMFTIGTFFSLYANRLYYQKVVAAVRDLRIQFGEQRDERAYVEALSSTGGYSKLAVLITVIVLFVIYFIVNSIISYLILF